MEDNPSSLVRTIRAILLPSGFGVGFPTPSVVSSTAILEVLPPQTHVVGPWETQDEGKEDA